MPDITLVPANFISHVLDSFLYGIVVLLFIADVYFLATRRTLAGDSRPMRHHFTSLIFLGVTLLFLIITIHWVLVVYQAYFAFIHLGDAASERTFYGDLSQPSAIAKESMLFLSILLGDILVIYRLWIIWGGNRRVAVLPACTVLGDLGSVASIGLVYQLIHWGPKVISGLSSVRGWTGLGFGLSLLNNVYCTGFIAFRIWKSKPSTDSRLMSFLIILVESAALQTFWLTFAALTILARSDAEFFATDSFPPVIGIGNLLIHARVGLGWSQDTVPKHVGTPLSVAQTGVAV
ncbi:hypothetical protein FB45DRAFT_1030165 [Roridomyces roridus]|uniref:Uncharacterized protein n=1 Tax=Roridomyces roridus TaxID=1738132 RepID=A0AAD7BNS9_9AGAR|nr:hypothetical protein FB45DRAFT_1030165 [Roridomyces roridus]